MKRHMHSLQGIPDGIYREARRLRREMTRSEKMLWARLRRDQIPDCHFRRQHILQGFIADFYCHKVKLIIEVDGGIHDDFREKDHIRDGILRAEGYEVIRFANARVENELASVVREIEQACLERLRLPSQPPLPARNVPGTPLPLPHMGKGERLSPTVGRGGLGERRLGQRPGRESLSPTVGRGG